MTARVVAFALAAALVGPPACAVQLTSGLHLGPPTVRLEDSEVLHATRNATIALPHGESVLQLPLDELGVEPADAVVEVGPADRVTLVGVRTSREPSITLWRLRAERAGDATISLTYPLKGLTWAVGYTATLSPEGHIHVQASLRVTNGLGRDLEDASLVGDGVRANLSLADGQSITVDQPWLSGMIPADRITRRIVYDRARHGEAPVDLLSFELAAPVRRMHGIPIVGKLFDLSGPLPSGRVRIYAETDAGPEFIADASLPYTPEGGSIELKLGPASGVVVTRTLEESKEVDRRLDARNRVVLFDLMETWVLEARNLRESPITLEIRQRHDGYWQVERSSHEYDRPEAEALVLNVGIDPGQRCEITYRLRHLNREP